MVSHNIEQIPKQQCQLFLVQTTLLRAVVDYESYKFYKYSCKILRYYILEGMAGVTMTLFCTHGRVSGPNSLLDHEVIAPCRYSVPCQF